MSTNDPHPPSGPEPEYLGSGSSAVSSSTEPSVRRSGGKRAGILAGAAVAVVAAVGVGGYGLVQLMAGGSSPATAVPADALAYVSLDLDPSASQKIEAIRIMRKFPGLRKELGISSRDDLRRVVFDQLVKESDCTGVDYARDVEPWIGDRVALAALPDAKDGAKPMVALQVTDEAKAERGVRALEKCDSSGTGAGVSFVGDYLVLTEKQAEADRAAKDAEAASLADDATYTRWLDRTGDAGIVTMYASPDAVDAIAASDPSSADQLRVLAKGFEGGAGVIRFADGAVEAEVSSRGMAEKMGAVKGAGPDVATLPGTTAALFSVALRDGWLQGELDSLKTLSRDSGGPSVDDMFAEAERATGLSLPEDLETLLGDGVTVSVDAGADLKALSEKPDPTRVPAGIRITGDPAEIVPIVEKLKKAAGPVADAVKVRSGEGQVALALDGDYAATLLEKGNLGSTPAFSDVVPEAGRATSVFYVNFDAGDGWAERLADLVSSNDPQVRANIAPLDALGVSGWLDDDGATHVLVRLTTD